jgi:hypothetical protein
LQQRLRGDNGAIPGDCAEVAPAEVAPAEVAPAEVAPAEVAPAEVAPAEVAPAGGAEVWDAAEMTEAAPAREAWEEPAGAAVAAAEAAVAAATAMLCEMSSVGGGEERDDAEGDGASTGTISPWISPAASPAGSVCASPRMQSLSAPHSACSTPLMNVDAMGGSVVLNDPSGASPPAQDRQRGPLPDASKARSASTRLDAILSELRTAKAAPRYIGRLARILNGENSDGEREAHAAHHEACGEGDSQSRVGQRSTRRGLASLFDSDESSDEEGIANVRTARGAYGASTSMALRGVAAAGGGQE